MQTYDAINQERYVSNPSEKWERYELIQELKHTVIITKMYTLDLVDNYCGLDLDAAEV